MIFKLNTLKDREAVKQYIDRLPDKPYIVKVKQKKAIRSMPQNRLYQMWVACVCSEIGYNSEELKLLFRQMFLPKSEFSFKGQITEIPISTTKLNTAEFTAYLDKIQIFASTELGIVLPNPEDLIFDSFVDYYADKF